jgi:hypothetical protein
MERPYAVPPPIDDFMLFLDALLAWWVQLQPPWREGGELSKQRPQSPVWGGLKIGGPCGLYSIVVSLAWCLKVCTDEPVFTSLVDDVTWVLIELVRGDTDGHSLR